MKRRASTTWGAIFLVFFTFFLIHQITLSSLSFISYPSSTNSTIIQGKCKELKSRLYGVPRIESPPIRCDRFHERYDVCYITGHTIVDPTMSTLFLVDPTDTVPARMENVRPYPRKWENGTMSHIKQLTLTLATSNTSTPGCAHRHEAPALVFSAGGYTGNLFHDFNDGFIPLFVTVRAIFADRPPVLAIVNCRGWWLSKYAEILRQFTPYPIINLDVETSTHCFPSATIGLISHGYMTIEPKLLPNPDTFLTFRALLANAYLHTKNHFPRKSTTQPRLVLVSRTGDVGRIVINQAEVKKTAEEIGFEVVVLEPNQYTSMSEAYGLINSSHAMFGVHGAALTHSLFLRPGAVFVQVVPIGIDWLAETCFGKPLRDMGIEYIEYTIGVEESSLVDKYGKDHLVLKDPKAIVKQSFANTKKIYLKNQNVRLDLVRVGRYLRMAHEKAMRFMNREG